MCLLTASVVDGPPRSVAKTKTAITELLAQLTQRPNLVAAQGVDGWLAVLGAVDMQ
jgi:hypothetical protein